MWKQIHKVLVQQQTSGAHRHRAQWIVRAADLSHPWVEKHRHIWTLWSRLHSNFWHFNFLDWTAQVRDSRPDVSARAEACVSGAADATPGCVSSLVHAPAATRAHSCEKQKKKFTHYTSACPGTHRTLQNHFALALCQIRNHLWMPPSTCWTSNGQIQVETKVSRSPRSWIYWRVWDWRKNLDIIVTISRSDRLSLPGHPLYSPLLHVCLRSCCPTYVSLKRPWETPLNTFSAHLRLKNHARRSVQELGANHKNTIGLRLSHTHWTCPMKLTSIAVSTQRQMDKWIFCSVYMYLKWDWGLSHGSLDWVPTLIMVSFQEVASILTHSQTDLWNLAFLAIPSQAFWVCHESFPLTISPVCARLRTSWILIRKGDWNSLPAVLHKLPTVSSGTCSRRVLRTVKSTSEEDQLKTPKLCIRFTLCVSHRAFVARNGFTFWSELSPRDKLWIYGILTLRTPTEECVSWQCGTLADCSVFDQVKGFLMFQTSLTAPCTDCFACREDLLHDNLHHQQLFFRPMFH